MNELIVVIAFACIFLGGEILLRTHCLNKEMARKFTHIASGIFTMVTPWLIPYSSIVWLAGLFSVVLLLLRGNPLLSSITTSERRTYGTWLMPLGIGVAAFLYPAHHLFLPSIAVVTLSDSLAGIAGRKSPKKTLIGSAVFFAITLCILLLQLSIQEQLMFLPFMRTILIALLLMIVERVSPYGTDNLLLPIATGAFLLALS